MKAEGAMANNALFEFALRLGDDRLILAHRLSEWCGHAPSIEEDIALANIALDSLGQAVHFLELAGRAEGKGRSADDLAYLRDAVEFRNVRLVEQPNGDFAYTILRLYFFSVYSELLCEALIESAVQELLAIAGKAVKEVHYHVRHSRQWVLRLGDGTEASHRRAESALEMLWPLAGELFSATGSESGAAESSLAPDLARLRSAWEMSVRETLAEATLAAPPPVPAPWPFAAPTGQHSEHLGHLLAEMQIVARSFPGAEW